MRKLTFFVMALAMVLGFTQCSKEQQPVETNENQGVRITLKVNDGGNGSRVNVDPNAPNGYATVTFEDGDVIYVGNNGSYCGFITFSGSSFSGVINPTNEEDYLHFYFMGNKGDNHRPSSVSISDQKDCYPVISYAHSKEFYNQHLTSYTAKLNNYCAIVKFPVAEGTDEDIVLRGMNNTVTVDFSANNAASGTKGEPYSFSKSGEGDIKLHAESSTEKWAILLPQDAINDAQVAIGITGYYVDIPQIEANTYVTSIDAISTPSGMFYPELLTIGQLIGDNAMVAYIGEVEGVCEHGLAISLTDAYEYNATFAEFTGGVILSSWKQCHPNPYGEWIMPSEEVWQYMLWGYFAEDPENQDISTFQNNLEAVGTALEDGGFYWTTTEVNDDIAKVVCCGLGSQPGEFFASFDGLLKTANVHVRACLTF